MAKKKTVTGPMWDAMYEELKRLAKNREVATYKDFGRKFNFFLEDGHYENKELFSVLGDFTIAEHEKGHPMISALIYRADTSLPGNGFFRLAESLYPQLVLSSEEKRMEFYYAELNRLFDFWAT